VDLTVFMSAFQGINKLRVTVELSVVDRGQYSEMIVQATAWDLHPADGDQPPSVLLSVRSTLAPKQTLDAAILQLLYVLDGRLADTEVEKTVKQR
jgi:hypothetical protein